MRTTPGQLVISLDFELYWGVRDRRSLASYRANLLGGRAAIPRMLDLFAEHDVHATWATVGMVFCDSRDELLELAPSERPAYRDASLSPYDDLAAIGPDERADPLHFGGSLVDRIRDTPGQEIGSHTFSHYYCLEPGQSTQQFAADLDAAIRAAERRGVALRTIVFPRNQVAEEYLPVCRERGFAVYRGGQAGWMHSPRASSLETPVRRAARLADAVAPVTGAAAYSPPQAHASGMIDVPASRFLRPRSRRGGRALRELVLRRVESEMAAAAKAGRIYHLWWHPHNFGADVDGHLADLARLLGHLGRLRSEHGMGSSTMAEAAGVA